MSIKDLFPHLPLIKGGDFNCRIGVLNQLEDSIFLNCNNFYAQRSSSDNFLSYKRKKLESFMGDNRFCVLNGRAGGDSPAQMTVSV